MSKSALRRIGATVAALVAVAGFSVYSAPQAAAAGCAGESCYNKGPVAMGCTADQRLISDPRFSPDLQVLYSPACQAAWAVSYAPPLHSCIYLELERARGNLVVHSRLAIEFCPQETKEWTNMLPGGGWNFRAVWNDRAAGHPDSYTPWVYR